MQELKDRIISEGRVLPGNIIKVDGFLNHRIDTRLMRNIADEFGKHFNMDEVTMILTAEASGIALQSLRKYPVQFQDGDKAQPWSPLLHPGMS